MSSGPVKLGKGYTGIAIHDIQRRFRGVKGESRPQGEAIVASGHVKAHGENGDGQRVTGGQSIPLVYDPHLGTAEKGIDCDGEHVVGDGDPGGIETEAGIVGPGASARIGHKRIEAPESRRIGGVTDRKEDL